MKAESMGWVPQDMQALRTRRANSYSFLPVPNTEWITDRSKVRAEFEEQALGCVCAETSQDSAPHSSLFVCHEHRLVMVHSHNLTGSRVTMEISLQA